MDRKELIANVAVVLTTAAETNPAPYPESMAYIALGFDIGKWELVKGVLAGAKLATFSGHNIQLTDKGRTMAAKIELAIA